MESRYSGYYNTIKMLYVHYILYKNEINFLNLLM